MSSTSITTRFRKYAACRKRQLVNAHTALTKCATTNGILLGAGLGGGIGAGGGYLLSKVLGSKNKKLWTLGGGGIGAILGAGLGAHFSTPDPEIPREPDKTYAEIREEDKIRQEQKERKLDENRKCQKYIIESDRRRMRKATEEERKKAVERAEEQERQAREKAEALALQKQKNQEQEQARMLAFNSSFRFSSPSVFLSCYNVEGPRVSLPVKDEDYVAYLNAQDQILRARMDSSSDCYNPEVEGFVRTNPGALTSGDTFMKLWRKLCSRGQAEWIRCDRILNSPPPAADAPATEKADYARRRLYALNTLRRFMGYMSHSPGTLYQPMDVDPKNHINLGYDAPVGLVGYGEPNP